MHAWLLLGRNREMEEEKLCFLERRPVVMDPLYYMIFCWS
jgi:hypothetical protein